MDEEELGSEEEKQMREYEESMGEMAEVGGVDVRIGTLCDV